MWAQLAKRSDNTHKIFGYKFTKGYNQAVKRVKRVKTTNETDGQTL